MHESVSGIFTNDIKPKFEALIINSMGLALGNFFFLIFGGESTPQNGIQEFCLRLYHCIGKVFWGIFIGGFQSCA